MIPTTDLLNDQLVDMKFLTAFIGTSDKFIYKLIRDGKFPKQIKIGSASRWLKSEIEAWLLARIAASRGVANAA
ncbi:helix-turn-helix transcriptional regulator [Citrobacter amalonaticus]|uniref:helix-turn-helix transcriptional regulator n=1 Tax=Citrobacter amalonaticus TaxID=35703 RepID=UPI00300C4B3B